MAVHVFTLGADLCSCCGLTRDQAAVHVKRGLRFEHQHFLDDTLKRPMIHVVTRVARGLVYYRPADGGSCSFRDVKGFLKHAMGKVL